MYIDDTLYFTIWTLGHSKNLYSRRKIEGFGDRLLLNYERILDIKNIDW